MLPRFTVITPSYNQGNFLEETLLSVQLQNYPNLEHLVIDGGSTDNSVNIIKKHERHLAYWVSEKDRGQTHAINKGLQKASGDIIMWLNSDDVLMPGALKKAAEAFEKNPQAILIHGKSMLFGENRKEQIIGKKIKDLKLRYLAYIPFPQPSSFFRKQLIEETGVLDESMHYGMDYELLARAALRYEIVFTDHLFSKYRLHAESKTNDALKFCKDWNVVFSRILNSFDFCTDLKKIMKELDIYTDETSKYIVKNHYSPKNIEKALLYHLLTLMHYEYNALRLNRAKRIAKEIKNISLPFYKQQKVGIVSARSSLLNKYLINLARKISRR